MNTYYILQYNDNRKGWRKSAVFPNFDTSFEAEIALIGKGLSYYRIVKVTEEIIEFFDIDGRK